MKNNLILLAFVLTTIFFSCKEDKMAKETSSENTAQVEESVMNQDEQAVNDFKTYTGEELNNWLPAKILDYVKEPSTLEFGNEELHQVKADYQYKGGHEKYITVEITNGQSQKDLRIKSSIVQRIEMKFAEDTESGYTKVHKRNNVEVFEMQGDYNNSCSLEYIINNQFYVRLDGNNLKAAELWQFADELNFKELTQK
ncbi:hypothetical protein [Flavobacterium sp.]|uniref:hypothetical protein n=1 Tax=Flavobacterium sp. TaxID=239 RepID=UPI00261881F4|nr:hypothetical protein [Flavobacterium sp.]MDD2986042.1 hypothetical protein [Flavobacterium sp.]